MQLTNLGGGVGYLKAGFFGFAGSGKTYTAVELALGTRKLLGLKGPIAMFDTEAAAQYLAPRVKKETGLDMIGFQSRSFADAVEFYSAAKAAGASVIIIDSVTHLWENIEKQFIDQRNAQRAQQGKNPMMEVSFNDRKFLNAKWAEFANLYLNDTQHVIINGRAGFEWGKQENDETGKQELVKTGVKMKVQTDFGFEPSLLVQMERIPFEQASAKLRSGLYVHRAEVLKDRFGVLDGQFSDNPSFEFFKPYVELLVPGAHASVDLTRGTPMDINDEGDAEWHREKRNRQIASENLAGALLAVWPGASAQEKLARQEVVNKVLSTRSWTDVENTSSDKLKAAIQCLPAAIEEVKAELRKREEAEAAAEAEAKAAKKAPKKAEEVKA